MRQNYPDLILNVKLLVTLTGEGRKREKQGKRPFYVLTHSITWEFPSLGFIETDIDCILPSSSTGYYRKISDVSAQICPITYRFYIRSI